MNKLNINFKENQMENKYFNNNYKYEIEKKNYL